VTEADLATNYTSDFDPRLNYAQAMSVVVAYLFLAVLIGAAR